MFSVSLSASSPALQAFHLAPWRGTDDSPETIALLSEKAFSDLERTKGPVNFMYGKDRGKFRPVTQDLGGG